MACDRHCGRCGGRCDVGCDVLGVRWPVLWSVPAADPDTSRFGGAVACIVLLSRDAGFVDRAQAGRVRLRAVGRLVRRSGAWYEIQCEPGGDRACAGACRRSGRWTLGVTLLSAVAIGIVYNFYLLFFYYQAFSFFSPRGLIGMACELLSAVVFAGFGSWVLYRALAKSGVLTRFASGR